MSPYPQRGTPALGLEEELILGDKAYIGIGVLTPKRSNMTRSENVQKQTLRVYGPNEADLVPPKGGPRRPWGGELWTNSLARARTRSSSPKNSSFEAALVPPKGGPRRP